MSTYFKTAEGGVSVFSKEELSNLLRPMDQETDAERRLRELSERNAELTRALEAEAQEEEREDDIDAMERENERLQRELAARRTNKHEATPDGRHQIGDQKMNTDLQALNTLDTLAKSATADHSQVAKSCSDLMEARVDAIEAEQGVSRSVAHARAAKSDGVYKRAYALHVQSHERAVQRQGMVDGMGAHF